MKVPNAWDVVQDLSTGCMLVEFALWKVRSVLVSLAETGEVLSSNRDKLRSLIGRRGR
ncbi:hypothetical protein [Streptomyces sp. NPDC046925]|uniref:hypothetical protein n=1 Tax=Streptomyces sp. NPDC046925 TaxID=3155375 RepID=UPI0034079F8B